MVCLLWELSKPCVAINLLTQVFSTLLRLVGIQEMSMGLSMVPTNTISTLLRHFYATWTIISPLDRQSLVKLICLVRNSALVFKLQLFSQPVMIKLLYISYPPYLSGGRMINEFHNDYRRIITVAEAHLHDTGISSRAITITGG